jgi:hypothetical protein
MDSLPLFALGLSFILFELEVVVVKTSDISNDTVRDSSKFALFVVKWPFQHCEG